MCTLNRLMLNGQHLHSAWEKCKALHRALCNVLNSLTQRLTRATGRWAELRDTCPDATLVTVQAPEQIHRLHDIRTGHNNSAFNSNWEAKRHYFYWTAEQPTFQPGLKHSAFVKLKVMKSSRHDIIIKHLHQSLKNWTQKCLYFYKFVSSSKIKQWPSHIRAPVEYSCTGV